MDGVRRFSPRRPTNPELAVFVSGVASMGLEILAGRIVAPQFGSSIYTWGSIITVFLAALSLGYYRGGKRAASYATTDRLIWLLLLTAVYVALLLFARDILLASTAAIPVPSRYASLPAVTMLFGPPTYLLGFISPYAAQLSHKRGIGEASGHVYAVGTIGSIVGAGATTFFLIPWLGIDGIGLLFGFLLVGTALVLTLPSPRPRPVLATLVVAMLLVAAVGSGAVGVDVRGDVVYRTQTPYQELEVIDSGDTRTLYLDGARHSAMDLENPDRHVFEYTRYFHLPLLMTEDENVDRVLFIGGGGYTGPKDFHDEYENATVDVVEIDPEVNRVAKEYFGVEETDRLNVHTGDGRQFLRNTDETYDVIVLDAYRQDKVPFQMTTAEFMNLAESRLSEDGVLLANVISAPSGPASDFGRAEYKTMERAFPQVYSFRTSNSPTIQNIELVASKDPERLTREELHERNERRDVALDLSDEIDSYYGPVETDDVPVLRDDRAPVDSLLDPMVGQQYVIEETEDGNESDDAEPAIALETGDSKTDAPASVAPPLWTDGYDVRARPTVRSG